MLSGAYLALATSNPSLLSCLRKEEREREGMGDSARLLTACQREGGESREREREALNSRERVACLLHHPQGRFTHRAHKGCLNSPSKLAHIGHKVWLSIG